MEPTGRNSALIRLAMQLDWSKDTDKVLGQFLRAIGERVLGESRRRAPSNLGHLRNSINLEMRRSGTTHTASIGTNLHYAPYMEFGTGLVHDHPSWPKKRHSPFTMIDGKIQPVPGLTAWSINKGFGANRASAIAWAIHKRGGLMPRRFLRGALESVRPVVVGGLEEAIRQLRRERNL